MTASHLPDPIDLHSTLSGLQPLKVPARQTFFAAGSVKPNVVDVPCDFFFFISFPRLSHFFPCRFHAFLRITRAVLQLRFAVGRSGFRSDFISIERKKFKPVRIIATAPNFPIWSQLGVIAVPRISAPNSNSKARAR
jgi:hypothetical protein